MTHLHLTVLWNKLQDSTKLRKLLRRIKLCERNWNKAYAGPLLNKMHWVGRMQVEQTYGNWTISQSNNVLFNGSQIRRTSASMKYRRTLCPLKHLSKNHFLRRLCDGVWLLNLEVSMELSYIIYWTRGFQQLSYRDNNLQEYVVPIPPFIGYIFFTPWQWQTANCAGRPIVH